MRSSALLTANLTRSTFMVVPATAVTGTRSLVRSFSSNPVSNATFTPSRMREDDVHVAAQCAVTARSRLQGALGLRHSSISYRAEAVVDALRNHGRPVA